MSTKNQLTLLMPGLFNRISNENSPAILENLAKVLTKSTVKNYSPPLSKFELLTKITNAQEVDTRALAALQLYGHDYDLKSWVCYVAPILLQPNRDHLSITRSSGFNLTTSEAASLCAEFNDYFKEDGVRFEVLMPELWVCLSNNSPEVSSKSPDQILGENIVAYLPSRESDVLWRKVFNEAQMLLHHSVTNQGRITAGETEINSFWFWGGGELPASFQSSFSQIFSNCGEMKGFAKLGGTLHDELPKNLSFKSENSESSLLVYIDVNQTDEYSRIGNYMNDVIRLMANGSLQKITIIPDFDKAFTYKTTDRFKFWRQQKNIEDFV